MADCDAVTGALAVRAGKGREDRVAYATNGARIALDAWGALRGQEPEAALLADRCAPSARRGM